MSARSKKSEITAKPLPPQEEPLEKIETEPFEGRLKRHLVETDPLTGKPHGLVDAHTHLDRAYTLDRSYFNGFDIDPIHAASTLSLEQKQALVGELHRGRAYQNLRNMEARMRAGIDDAMRQGITTLTTFIDATPDIGLGPIQLAARLREEYRHKGFQLKLATQPIFGLLKDDPTFRSSRWEVFQEACKIADSIGALPEKDARFPNGFDTHIFRAMELGGKLGRLVEVHTDQANRPDQRETLRVIEAYRWARLQWPNLKVKVIHAISLACYKQALLEEAIAGLTEYNIDVVVCPRAALSMRQDRRYQAPIHNSIAPILQMALSGVRIWIGRDNIADVFIPTGSSILKELLILTEMIRFYDIPVLVKWATGQPLNATNLDTIRDHLRKSGAL